MIERGTSAANDNRKHLPRQVPTNWVSLVGRLCFDPIVRKTEKGQPIVHFSLSATTPATGPLCCEFEANGLMGGATCHHVVVADDQLAEIATTELASGSVVYLEGQLQTRRASQPSAAPKIVTEIVLIGVHARLRPHLGYNAR